LPEGEVTSQKVGEFELLGTYNKKHRSGYLYVFDRAAIHHIVIQATEERLSRGDQPHQGVYELISEKGECEEVCFRTTRPRQKCSEMVVEGGQKQVSENACWEQGALHAVCYSCCLPYGSAISYGGVGLNRSIPVFVEAPTQNNRGAFSTASTPELGGNFVDSYCCWRLSN